MVSFEVSVVINKPVSVIVKALMNPDNHPYWNTDLERFEVIKKKAGMVGSIGHLHFNQNGQKYILKDECIECTPGKKYVSIVSGDPLTARVETTLTKLKNKTKMSIKWDGKPNMFLLKLLLPLMRGKMIKQSQAELEKFKELVETKGINFSKK